MKQALIYKGFEPEDITDEDLRLINRYARRALTKDEVYVFPLVLCDNDVDRDGEKFSVEALRKLRRLFVGKTGVFDHDAKGENQVARIFSTQVEKDELRRTSDGDVYEFLTARAYMARSEKTRDLILEIDAGIKKEVSVGCAVEAVRCSVCGADVRRTPCEHVPGREYNGQKCHRVLEGPTDAYEWSFVAVPAQPAAGVTKAFEPGEGAPRTVEEISGALQKGAAVLSAGEAAALARELETLREKARAGEAYREELIRDVLRRAVLCGSPVSQKALQAITGKLEADELKELAKTFPAPGAGFGPGVVQTARAKETEHAGQPDKGYVI